MCVAGRNAALQPSRLLRVALLNVAVSQVIYALNKVQLMREMLILLGLGSQNRLSRQTAFWRLCPYIADVSGKCCIDRRRSLQRAVPKPMLQSALALNDAMAATILITVGSAEAPLSGRLTTSEPLTVGRAPRYFCADL